VLSSAKKAFLALRGIVTVLFLAVLYCLAFRHTCSFCLPVQVVTFSHGLEYVFDNHGRFCIFGKVPFGILSLMCINCCSQFCKDILISLLLISASQLVLCISPDGSGLRSHLLHIGIPLEFEEYPVMVRVSNRWNHLTVLQE